VPSCGGKCKQAGLEIDCELWEMTRTSMSLPRCLLVPGRDWDPPESFWLGLHLWVWAVCAQEAMGTGPERRNQNGGQGHNDGRLMEQLMD